MEFHRRVSDSLEVKMELSSRTWIGVALFSAVLLTLPLLNAQHLGQLQALNRELGKLCSNPPHEALKVCQLHARLLNTI